MHTEDMKCTPDARADMKTLWNDESFVEHCLQQVLWYSDFAPRYAFSSAHGKVPLPTVALEIPNNSSKPTLLRSAAATQSVASFNFHIAMPFSIVFVSFIIFIALTIRAKQSIITILGGGLIFSSVIGLLLGKSEKLQPPISPSAIESAISKSDDYQIHRARFSAANKAYS